jgi:hypothetical protein
VRHQELCFKNKKQKSTRRGQKHVSRLVY